MVLTKSSHMKVGRNTDNVVRVSSNIRTCLPWLSKSEANSDIRSQQNRGNSPLTPWLICGPAPRETADQRRGVRWLGPNRGMSAGDRR